MVAPALVYLLLNRGDSVALKGWAIPTATDIAFALGILALVGSRVPLALKVFLVSIAIFDDLGAIVIIALFYTSALSLEALLVAVVCLPVLALMNRRGVTTFMPYLLIGVVMWIAVLKSGVHATLAGVAVALFIPLRNPRDPEKSPLRDLEHDLHGPVAFGILPLFAFVNSGIPLVGMKADAALHSVPLGIALGLFLGKQIGIFGLCLLGLRTGIARLPEGMSMRSLYGVSILCGVGFTMSLFIGSLAFENVGPDRIFDERLGIVAGSLLSGVVGYFLLKRSVAHLPVKVD
jgi:NhaA family Na+:H+ antiporter